MGETRFNAARIVYRAIGFHIPWCDPAHLGYGDFNGDGKLDLICNSDDGKHLIAFSNGDGTFTPASWWPADRTVQPMSTARTGHTATLLPNGQVLVVGGQGQESYSSPPLASAEIYNPATDKWSPATSMITARTNHTATLLPNGQVLVVGGFAGLHPLANVEIYDPASDKWFARQSLPTARYVHTETLLNNGLVLTIGGASGAEKYDSAANAWSTAGDFATSMRTDHTATLLLSGNVLVAGGAGPSGGLASAYLYDPTSNAWSPRQPLPTERYAHTATNLGVPIARPRDLVLVAGGWEPTASNPALAPSAEIYNPDADAWSNARNLVTPRANHTATLLPNGQVLVVGGGGASGVLAGAEVYDLTTNQWSSGGSLTTARANHTATLLPNGQVLVIGGAGASGVLASAELSY
jgi:N-acetylneuraminic acid mutarotase